MSDNAAACGCTNNLGCRQLNYIAKVTKIMLMDFLLVLSTCYVLIYILDKEAIENYQKRGKEQVAEPIGQNEGVADGNRDCNNGELIEEKLCQCKLRSIEFKGALYCSENLEEFCKKKHAIFRQKNKLCYFCPETAEFEQETGLCHCPNNERIVFISNEPEVLCAEDPIHYCANHSLLFDETSMECIECTGHHAVDSNGICIDTSGKTLVIVEKTAKWVIDPEQYCAEKKMKFNIDPEDKKKGTCVKLHNVDPIDADVIIKNPKTAPDATGVDIENSDTNDKRNQKPLPHKNDDDDGDNDKDDDLGQKKKEEEDISAPHDKKGASANQEKAKISKSSNKSSNIYKIYMIIGISIGSVALVVAIGTVLYFKYWKKKNKLETSYYSNDVIIGKNKTINSKSNKNKSNSYNNNWPVKRHDSNSNNNSGQVENTYVDF